MRSALPAGHVLCSATVSAYTHRHCLDQAPEQNAGMQLKELKSELGALRVAKVTGGAPNKLAKMCVFS